jgi:hypothetical protein
MLDTYNKHAIIKQMIRTMVYLTEEQARDIKLQAKREQRPEAEVIRELISKGQKASPIKGRESTGDALLRLAKLGEELQFKAPADTSARIDEILYDEK